MWAKKTDRLELFWKKIINIFIFSSNAFLVYKPKDPRKWTQNLIEIVLFVQ